jgi:hypothetical protein
MTLQNKIDKLMSSGNPIGEKLAQKIKNINDALEAKEITPDEAKDLLNDIDVATHLVELANDLETKILVQQTVDALIYIIETLI